ncbi:MAG: fused MFS/spermidine synthase [Pseudomonadota bacterium]
MILLEAVESEFGTINILKKRDSGSISYMQNGCCQSEADGGGVSLASYIHALFGLLSQAGARKILLIGCGGGTLATMLSRSHCKVTIVDIDRSSFALARQYFDLPLSVECHVRDGKAFLRSDASVYDAVVLDAFHGDQIPLHLRSSRFFNLIRDRLAQLGTLFVNVHVRHDADELPDRIASGMADVWPEVRVLDSEGYLGRNAIVMAGAVAHLQPPQVIVPPETDAKVIDEELATMKYRPWRNVP